MARIILLVAFFTFFSAVYSADYKCAGVATYKLSFYGKWSNMTHPFAFPTGGQFSPLVGCSLGTKYTVWMNGMEASPGVKEVAETGNATTLRNEIQAAIDTTKTAWKVISTSDPIGNTAHVMDIAVEVTQDFPYVSLITMIAPSPDWFTGIMKRSLCDSSTGKWMDSLKIDMLSPWDAGTDDGTRFNSNNTETVPPDNITIITKDSDTDFMNLTELSSIPTLGQLMFNRTNKPTMNKCSGEQKYMVKVEALWSKKTHPNGFPTGNAHFSPLVIATHTYRYKFWSDMTRASPGVKEVAETGAPDTLYNEIMAMKQENFVSNVYKGAGTFNSPGNDATMMITVKEKYPMMSFISMIAPSPDWFVGLDSLDLCGSNGWKDNVMMDLGPWDAGTDSGFDFESDNNATMPVDFITRITSASHTVIGGDASKAFAKIAIKKYEEKVEPNSAHGLSAGVLTFPSIAFLAILRLLY